MAAIDVKKMVRKHGALVSAVTAGSVAAFIFVQQALKQVVFLVGSLPYQSASQGELIDASPIISLDFIPLTMLVLALPFGVGFFVSLWLIAPIAAELRIGHVITRAVLATGVASTVYFVVSAILGLIDAFQPSGGSLAGNEFPWPQFSGERAVFALGNALQGALSTLIGMLPLGVLAGVLLWLWRKDHPPKHPLSGYIDEI